MHVDTIDGLKKDTYLTSQQWNHFNFISLLNCLFLSTSPTPNKFLFHVSKHLEIPVLSAKMLLLPPLPKSSSKIGRGKKIKFASCLHLTTTVKLLSFELNELKVVWLNGRHTSSYSFWTWFSCLQWSLFLSWAINRLVVRVLRKEEGRKCIWFQKAVLIVCVCVYVCESVFLSSE